MIGVLGYSLGFVGCVALREDAHRGGALLVGFYPSAPSGGLVADEDC